MEVVENGAIRLITILITVATIMIVGLIRHVKDGAHGIHKVDVRKLVMKELNLNLSKGQDVDVVNRTGSVKQVNSVDHKYVLIECVACVREVID